MRVRGFLCGGVRMRRLRGNPLFMGGRGDEPVRGTSALTVEGDLPGSLAISLHGVLRSGILWTVSRSCSMGRAIRPSGYRIPAFIRTCSYECGRCSGEVDIQGVDLFSWYSSNAAGFFEFVDANITLLSKEDSAPAGKPDVWRGVRDAHSGHGRDRIFHAEGFDPIAPRGFRGGRTGRQGTGIQAVQKEGCNASPSILQHQSVLYIPSRARCFRDCGNVLDAAAA